MSLQPIAATVAATVAGEYAEILTMQRIVDIDIQFTMYVCVSQQVVLQQPLSAAVGCCNRRGRRCCVDCGDDRTLSVLMMMLMTMMMMNEFPLIAG